MFVGMLYVQVIVVFVYLFDLRLFIVVGIEGFFEVQLVISFQNMEFKVMQNVKFNIDFGNFSKILNNICLQFSKFFYCFQDVEKYVKLILSILFFYGYEFF